MQLWNDYEGVTIDGAFPLQKLLLPEGRSAFFSTAGPKGEPTVVRLIECHFDEEAILARWRCVEALNHPNFLKFEHYGQIELDGGPVVYAVFEKVDGNLAEVLDRGRLAVKDVAQLASSLVAALDVLYTHGFVHEHVEPRNIFAVGEVVKLRGDCIRETPEGEEGRAARQLGVHDLATVLLQALTQRQTLEGIPEHMLPPPFGEIIRNGLSGAWELENMKAALEGRLGPASHSAAKPVQSAPAMPAVIQETNVPATAPKPPVRPNAQLSLPLADEDKEATFAGPAAYNETRRRKDPWGEDQSFSLKSRWLGAAGLVVFLLLLMWLFVHGRNAHRGGAAPPSAGVAQPAAQLRSAAPATQRTPATSPRAAASPLAASHAGWRVISFTYNRRADAEKKVASLERSHPDLKIEVFTPSGRAPYLVSIGGVMNKDAAYALARRSRSLGLPRDSYAQNYTH